MILRGVLFALLITGTAAVAGAPVDSLRPVLRGGNAAVLAPNETGEQPQAKRERRVLFNSLRPIFRSNKAEREGRAARRLAEKGAICGDIAIQGVAIGRVKGAKRGCGVENAVRVRSVSGVALSTASVMDCGTATALKSWMEGAAKPALSRKGGGLKSIKVAAHYACRTRNTKKARAFLSMARAGRLISLLSVCRTAVR